MASGYRIRFPGPAWLSSLIGALVISPANLRIQRAQAANLTVDAKLATLPGPLGGSARVPSVETAVIEVGLLGMSVPSRFLDMIDAEHNRAVLTKK